MSKNFYAVEKTMDQRYIKPGLEDYLNELGSLINSLNLIFLTDLDIGSDEAQSLYYFTQLIKDRFDQLCAAMYHPRGMFSINGNRTYDPTMRNVDIDPDAERKKMEDDGIKLEEEIKKREEESGIALV